MGWQCKSCLPAVAGPQSEGWGGNYPLTDTPKGNAFRFS